MTSKIACTNTIQSRKKTTKMVRIVEDVKFLANVLVLVVVVIFVVVNAAIAILKLQVKRVLTTAVAA